MELEIIRRQPSTQTHDTPLLFIHGAWHGAWCWDEYFLPYFEEQGFLAHALSLSAHGKSPKTKPIITYTIWDYVEDVAKVSDHIEKETGKRPILIGHSMGGYITQKYLERYTAPAAVLVATIPVVGTLPFQLRLMAHHPLAFTKTVLTLNAIHLVTPPSLAKKMFFSESVPLEQVEDYHNKGLQGESLWILVDAGIINRPKPDKINPTPMLVVAGENDKVFTVHEEETTAKAYNATFNLYEDMAHDMMLEPDWQLVADDIIEWLIGQGF